jgi:hypothetical protein
LVESFPKASKVGTGLLALPEPVMGHGQECPDRRRTVVKPIGSTTPTLPIRRDPDGGH